MTNARRDGNSNIEEGLLTAWLTPSGYTPALLSTACSASPPARIAEPRPS